MEKQMFLKVGDIVRAKGQGNRRFRIYEIRACLEDVNDPEMVRECKIEDMEIVMDDLKRDLLKAIHESGAVITVRSPREKGE